MSKPDLIFSFSGQHRFLSNFFPSPIEWRFAPVTFPTVEHGFVWHKTENGFVRQQVLRCDTPGKVKRFGRTFKLRHDWDDIKFSVMTELVMEKFLQNPELRGLLLSTGDAELIEGNHWHDNLWGVCTCGNCVQQEGVNKLGRILMQTREVLR